ncbi:MAG TPA: HAD-IIIA family hydrolase [Rudaea sp.]
MVPPIRHVILDRDGVLNVEQSDGGWVSDWSQWRWLPGAIDGLRVLSAARIRISIATNQSGVGRGLVDRANVDAVHARMVDDAARGGATIHEVFVCPHGPDDACDCRKPESGLFVKAISASGVHASQTIALGDDLRDLRAAWSAGVTAALVRTGKGHLTEAIAGQQVPTYDDLRDFARAIVADSVPRANQGLLIAHRIFGEHGAVVREAAVTLPPVLAQLSKMLQECIASGKKVLACGNGGSAATAQHFVAELVGRFRLERRALAAVALTADPIILTALANDYGYARVFARQIEALGACDDVLMAFSTSGNSPNVVEAAQTARQMGCKVIAFTGDHGGSLASHADVILRAPSRDVARIQEVHDICIHALAEALEEATSRCPSP